MKLSRRDFVVGGVGLLLSGCAPASQRAANRPGAPWPLPRSRPRRITPIAADGEHAVEANAAAQGDLSKLIARTKWAKGKPIRGRLNRMGAIKRITVHHEGGSPVYFSDVRTTAERLEAIRKAHLQRMHAGDIGYHYIIDRSGRLWQGRDIGYQGAHVREHNEHNIGVMVLGNFDRQSPTAQQRASLHATLEQLMRQHRVALHNVHTHQELVATQCPGRVLQHHMKSLRGRA
jgi:hypothetical protein